VDDDEPARPRDTREDRVEVERVEPGRFDDLDVAAGLRQPLGRVEDPLGDRTPAHHRDGRSPTPPVPTSPSRLGSPPTLTSDFSPR
jgi:hypothetical protein